MARMKLPHIGYATTEVSARPVCPRPRLDANKLLGFAVTVPLSPLINPSGGPVFFTPNIYGYMTAWPDELPCVGFLFLPMLSYSLHESGRSNFAETHF